MASNSLRIGTRGSKLALVQAGLVAAALERRRPDLQIELVTIKTTGDERSGSLEPLVKDKREWIHEIEEALCIGNIDCAVHSGKDVPVDINQSTTLLPVLGRANACDAFIGRGGTAWETLPAGAVVGTSSKRRAAQVQRLRSDLNIEPCHGNVPTRLEKLKETDHYSGIILACAGLKRLNVPEDLIEPIAVSDLLPAMNQGTLVVQYQSKRSDIAKLLKELVMEKTLACFTAERACIKTLGADCHSAVGAYAEVKGAMVHFTARVLAPDGSACLEERGRGGLIKSKEIGTLVAEELLARGAGEMIAKGNKTYA